jgi:plastocyanin
MSLSSIIRSLLAATLLSAAAMAGAANTHAATVALISSSNPAILGQPVTLSAQLTGLSDGTAIAFKDGTALLGTGALKAGTATLTTSFSSAGSHALTAAPAAPVASTSSGIAALSQTIALAPSSSVLLSSNNPVIYGVAVKLTANVGGVSPTGTVTFRDTSTATATVLGTAPVLGGSATITANFAVGGTHPVQASYSGDWRNTASISPALSQMVSPAASSTTLASASNPLLLGQSVLLTARIVAPNSTGTVTFKDGSTTLGSATVSASVATLSTSFSLTGVHALSASFGGNPSAAASSSNVVSETVNPTPSRTDFKTSMNPAPVGQSILLSAAVTPASGSGTATFKDGNTVLGTVAVTAGAASLPTSFQTLGSHTLSVAFSGTALVAASQSATLAQSVIAASSKTTLATSATAPALGQTFTLSAAVTGWKPTGAVTFFDAGKAIGSSALGATGLATLTTSLGTIGTHSLSASYAGNALNTASASAAVSLAVSGAASQTVVSASPSTVTVGQAVILTAKVTGSNPTGTVTFSNGSAPMATAGLVSGSAVFTTTFSTAGTYSILASYSGNASNAPSASARFTLNVTSGTGPKPPATGNGINYNGGPVMSSGTNLYYIWYGSWTGSPVPAVLNAFGNGIGGSPYYHINTSYSDNSGKAVADSVTLMPSISDNYSQGKSLTDNMVFSVVSSAISSGKLPLDPNGIYFVFSSADVDETSGFCTQYCGWHSSASLNGVDVKFSFIGNPDRCPSACTTSMPAPNGSRAGDGMASVLAHELSETVSDPDLNAWFSSSGQENGDLCAWNFGSVSHTASGLAYNLVLPTGNFLIQQMWLNARGGACVLSYP